MKKQNNKGFSLIELLIAVAVMTILITPIISQLFETVKISGQAKEKQYVIDSVDNVLENFRSFDDGQLKADNDSITDPILGTVKRLHTYNNVTCNLCQQDGSPVSGSVTTVQYNQIEYELSDIGLGKSKSHKTDKTNYTRKIIKNDLNNKLAEAGFQIDYSISSSSGAPSGFDWRSDNIVAISNANDCFTSIVVKPLAGKVNDPNTISLANLQNIDASSIAIIQSDATTLDYQIEKDLSALLVTYAMHPANSNTTIGKMAGKPKDLNDYIKTLVNNPYAIDKTRSIHLTITAGRDTGGNVILEGTKPKFYHVRCDVVYRVAFKGASTDLITPFSNNTSAVGSFSYNVLDRNYYTDKPTNVLLVYEPLLLSTQSGSATKTFYADNDYIDITTDDYTDGTQLGEKSTVYLIGSSKNWAKATNTPRDTYINDGINYSMYRTFFGSDYRDVNIVVSQTTGGGLIDVYTNIGVGYNETTGAYKKIPDDPSTNPFTPYNGHVLTRQFDIDGVAYADKPPVYKNDMTTELTCSAYGSLDTSNVADPFTNIKPYYEENVTDEGRLYQVTVVYQNKDSNEKTYITGAKGAN